MRLISLLLSLLLLGGCDQLGQKLGLEDPAKKEAKLDAEGKAVGSACRQSGRAIEDCYAIYSWLPKSSVFEGWREMDAYMRDNKIDTVAPQLPPPEPPGSKKKKKAASAEENNSVPEIKLEKAGNKALEPGADKPAEAPAEPTGDKTSDKPGDKTPEKPAAKVESKR